MKNLFAMILPLGLSSIRAADTPSLEQRLQALEQYVGSGPDYQVARFAESPSEWILWSLNLVTVLFALVFGCYLVFRRKQLWLIPVWLGVLVSFGATWFLLVTNGARLVPYVICTSVSRTPVNLSGAYYPAWGLALSLVFFSRKYWPNKRPETNAGKESVSPTTPGPGVAHP